MSALTVWLEKRGIVNISRLVSKYGRVGQDIYVTYSKGQGVVPACARVVSPSRKTDPSAHWTDNGCKSFSGSQRDAVAQAVAWASDEYGITEWAPSPFGNGGKVPKYIVDAVKAFMKG